MPTLGLVYRVAVARFGPIGNDSVAITAARRAASGIAVGHRRRDTGGAAGGKLIYSARMHIFAFVFLTVVACATGSVGSKPTPQQGEPCDAAGQCARGLQCVKYFGIAGARGPQFTSCEIRCGEGGKCPNGQSCRTIADGPGQVCRPAK
jgi:hypothetical protein